MCGVISGRSFQGNRNVPISEARNSVPERSDQSPPNRQAVFDRYMTRRQAASRRRRENFSDFTLPETGDFEGNSYMSRFLLQRDLMEHPTEGARTPAKTTDTKMTFPSRAARGWTTAGIGVRNHRSPPFRSLDPGTAFRNVPIAPAPPFLEA